MKQQATLTIAADHPAFAGHFPGMPIVPGVLLLDEALHAIAAGRPEQGWQINSAKFLHPLPPGASVVIEYEAQANGSVRFDSLYGERHVATGVLVPAI